jgi:hypothetical protein
MAVRKVVCSGDCKRWTRREVTKDQQSTMITYNLRQPIRISGSSRECLRLFRLKAIHLSRSQRPDRRGFPQGSLLPRHGCLCHQPKMQKTILTFWKCLSVGIQAEVAGAEVAGVADGDRVEATRPTNATQ